METAQTPIKALIVDDEFKARDLLKYYIETHVPQIAELRQAESVDEALEILIAYEPDIVFLDIEMPHRNGFDFLKSLPKIEFDVIFTTAYNQYAIQAIRFSALDYLLKPVDPGELKAAIARFFENRMVHAATGDLYQNLVQNIGVRDVRELRIAVPSSEGVQFFMIDDILCLHAEGSYTEIVLKGRKPFIASKILKHFEDLLENAQFIRTHKSHLVNQTHIKGMTSDRDFVILSDDSKVEISRRKKDEVMQMLGLR
jgi:two-component system, LytTR family, response regulator